MSCQRAHLIEPRLQQLRGAACPYLSASLPPALSANTNLCTVAGWAGLGTVICFQLHPTLCMSNTWSINVDKEMDQEYVAGDTSTGVNTRAWI